MKTTCFPRYTEHVPLVPVWCVTPNRGGCIHRFFDTSPISPSGRFLAVFRLPFEDHRPKPGDTGHVCLVDLDTGAERVLAESRGWEPQLGANVNWGGSDDELYFNDVDVQDWKPFAWRINPLNGAKVRMDAPVYHASPDGRWLISADLSKMAITQPGYGVAVPASRRRTNVGPSADDGFTITDTRTGRSRLLVSIREILMRAQPPIGIENPEKQEIYGFHCKFNPQGTRLMLSLRWFPRPTGGWRERCGRVVREVQHYRSTGQWESNTFAMAFRPVRFAWVTAGLDGGDLCCAIGPEQWDKGGHHATWCPDGKRISMNLDLDREGCMRFVVADARGARISKLTAHAIGSGHPTLGGDDRHILTDAYPHDAMAFGDGTVPLRWINLASGAERCLVRMFTRASVRDPALRVDPHPAWDRQGRFIVFNGFAGGTRRVYVADMASLFGKPT